MKIKLKISSSSFADSNNKPPVACRAYEIMVATLYGWSFAAWLHQPKKLCFVKCSVYLLVDFQKNMQLNQSVSASRPLPFAAKPSRLKMLTFQPPNILTPSEKGQRGLKKKRGFKGSFALVIKRPPRLLTFASFVCYLRQLCFAMYTESNFSYSLESSSATLCTPF